MGISAPISAAANILSQDNTFKKTFRVTLHFFGSLLAAATYYSMGKKLFSGDEVFKTGLSFAAKQASDLKLNSFKESIDQIINYASSLQDHTFISIILSLLVIYSTGVVALNHLSYPGKVISYAFPIPLLYCLEYNFISPGRILNNSLGTTLVVLFVSKLIFHLKKEDSAWLLRKVFIATILLYPTYWLLAIANLINQTDPVLNTAEYKASKDNASISESTGYQNTGIPTRAERANVRQSRKQT